MGWFCSHSKRSYRFSLLLLWVAGLNGFSVSGLIAQSSGKSSATDSGTEEQQQIDLRAQTISESIGTRRDSERLFQESIVEIFQRRCLTCHQDQSKEGDFSLSSASSAFADGHIIPGDLDGSRLWEVVNPVNGKAEMPKDGDALTADELVLIRKWIQSGAEWPVGDPLTSMSLDDSDWWSFQPLQQPTVPVVEATESSELSVGNPIDAFVSEKLSQQQLSPSSTADKRVLLRRLKYDLLGLPPTPSEVRSFEDNSDPLAYEMWVEKYLDSKHYGERWARHWLDVAKYADTCGYDKDKLRENAWPYRDYVIRSFNEDKPYRRFVQEQIAGDVLFPGKPDGILGLGFISAGPWDFIGHVEVPETKLDGKVARNLDRDDMVSGAFNTFCSLTVQCARCHHHKFDPISQQQYYGLQAIFAAVDRAERVYDTDPETESRRNKLQAEIKQARVDLKAIEEAIAKEGGEALVRLNDRFKTLQEKASVIKNDRFGYHSQITKKSLVEKWLEIDLGKNHALQEIVLHACHDEYAEIGAGFGFPVRYRVEIFQDADGETGIVVLDQTSQDVENPGLRSVRVPLDLTSDLQQRVHRVRITATKLAERKNDYHFSLAEVEAISRDGENVALGKSVTSLDSIEAPTRWARQNLTDGHWAQYQHPEVVDELAEVTQQRSALLEKLQSPDRLERKAAIQTRLAKAESDLGKLPVGKLVYAAATDFSVQGNFKPTSAKPRAIHVLARGEVSKPLEVAPPELLPMSGDWPKDWSKSIDADAPEGHRRARLAQWLTHSSNSLLWRSIVNRVWLYHFGQALVATPNDFGRMGATPTHPDLLDWLAAEFRDGGKWIRQGSFKDLHRLIVTSNTYQQSSAYDAEKSKIDSDNRWLWRMNRRRLEAEEMRDSILFVSGALDKTMGGPGYRPFKLERPQHSPHYEYHKFDHSNTSTHRRSIYRFIVRSQPDPWMTTMDCADSSQSTPKRDETLTALQSLSLLNNQFNLVMAERFQQRLEKSSELLEEQVDLACGIVMQRQADADTRSMMIAYAKDHGMVNLCRFLFNLSEFIYID